MNRTGYEIFFEDGKAGLKDADGIVVVPCQYDSILNYDDDGYIRVLNGDVYGTLDLEGKEVIPHSLGLTHLGVFHKGTARARKNGRWGLVDERGNAVGGFNYASMEAHRKWGYAVTTPDGQQGVVDERGLFTSTAQSYKVLDKVFQEVRTFHDGIAPAYSYQNKWVFVDRDYKRVNQYEYWSIDPVLRKGLYTVAYDSHNYTAAFYDGTPFNGDTYEYPLHFDNGFSQCCKLHLDENGKEIPLPNGQPLYDYGIVDLRGKYLFPMVYSSLNWNDPDTHDCWFAEDEVACYLLYPDGDSRAYLKSQAVTGVWDMRSIPQSETDNYLSDELLECLKHQPETITTCQPVVFNEKRFMSSLRLWAGQFPEGLKFYYRDTDTPLDVDKIYRKGWIVRCGQELEATRKLLRPVGKLRFMIAAMHLFEVSEYEESHDGKDSDMPYDEAVIGRNSYFVVMDVYRLSGVTQVLLLQMPREAAAVAVKNGYRFMPETMRIEGPGCVPLIQYARHDLQGKMAAPVHGHSLSDKWTEKMRQPIGLDSRLRPVRLKMDSSLATSRKEARLRYRINYEPPFFDTGFTIPTKGTVVLMLGDITNLFVDAIVDATFDTGGKGTEGVSIITVAYGHPYKKIIYTLSPVWHDGKHKEPELLESCYDAAMRRAEENHLESIAFPCLCSADFPREIAARISIDTVLRHIMTGKYSGQVIFCCHSGQEAELYKKMLGRAPKKHTI